MTKEFEKKMLEVQREQVDIMKRVWDRIEIMQNEIHTLEEKVRKLETCPS